MKDTAVRHQVLIQASRERVFEAWTHPDELARWYVDRAEGDPRVDRRITWVIAGQAHPLEVTVCEAGWRLVLTNVSAGPWQGSVIDVALIREGRRTLAVLAQRGFADALEPLVPNVDAGWQVMLAVLKEYVEQHAGEPRRETTVKREVVVDPVAVAEALGGGAAAIAAWAGEAPTRVLASTPRGALAAWAGIPGVFTFMGVNGVVVRHTAWGDADPGEGQARAAVLADRLVDRVRLVDAGGRSATGG